MTYVTTVLKAPAPVEEQARSRAAALGLPYRERQAGLDTMGSGADSFLVYGKKEPALWHDGAVHRFHTGTTKLRLLQIKQGGSDRLCRLLPEGTASVLDCTFGEGKDSMVLSWYLGEKGQVTALEKSPALWEIGQWGLRHFRDPYPGLTEALRRIRLIRGDFQNVLREAPSRAYDVVYFDTMFRKPVKPEENKRDAFRNAACYDKLNEVILQEAARAARRCVIVKERPFSDIFRMGLFHELCFRKGQSTAYGVIHV